jgi:hypothetical protein
MTAPSNLDDRIRSEFSVLQKEYAAFDRTLDALAAFSLILRDVKEIALETEIVNFRPRIQQVEPDTEPYTPDGLIVLKRNLAIVLELKTSWNESDPRQICKYGKSPGFLRADRTQHSFGSGRCVLLGYQNTPGASNLEKLFDAWKTSNLEFPLVIFRYSLEQGPEGDRMFFVRVPFAQNGECPSSSFGKAINSPRGFPVSTDSYKLHRARFHRANDQVISSYAAILWWTKYARQYLSEEQRSEMAARGRLASPLVLSLDALANVPSLPDVEVPLGPKDVRRALEFLTEAKVVALKRRAKAFEVELKEDRYIRFPQGTPSIVGSSQQDISTKILLRWAFNKVRNPIVTRVKRSSRRKSSPKRSDDRTGWLFP